MSDRVLARIDDMLRAIDVIETITSEADRSEIEASIVKTWAMERAIEIISEASRHIPEDLKHSEPAIPWRQIAGVGNILRHGYQTVRAPILLNIVADDLPVLKAALSRLQGTLLASPLQP